MKREKGKMKKKGDCCLKIYFENKYKYKERKIVKIGANNEKSNIE